MSPIEETLIYILKAIRKAIDNEDMEYIKFLLKIYKELFQSWRNQNGKGYITQQKFKVWKYGTWYLRDKDIVELYKMGVNVDKCETLYNEPSDIKN